jgi:hypothetical protein
MSIAVFRALTIADRLVVSETLIPDRSNYRLGHVASVLTNMPARATENAPAWDIEIEIGQGYAMRTVRLPLQQFLTCDEYARSRVDPLCFQDLGVDIPKTASELADLRWLWLFRDALYVTERLPRPSEIEEVTLRIKSLHFQEDEGLRRLREQVANFEAIETHSTAGRARQPIPDDVKLVVWSRDGGVCVKCGASQLLHFDHIIPLAKGGSDTAENIQLLCRTCNLSKSSRLV